MTHRRWIRFSFLFAIVFAGSACRKPRAVTPVEVVKGGVEVRNVEPSSDALWPMFRGPDGNGLVADQAVPTVWNESTGVVWQSDVAGRGHGSPIVVGDKVLLATADDVSQQQSVCAYSRTNGDLLWSQVIHQGNFPSASEVHQKGTNANSTLASDGTLAFIAFFNSGKVTATALDLNGDLVWTQDLGAFASKFGYAPSPILYKSFVIFAVDNFGGGYIAALDGLSGQIAWRISRPAQNSHSTPFIAKQLGGKDQMLISGCDSVTSYDPSTGDQLWSTPCTSETTCGTMVRSGDRVFASGGYPKSQTVCLDAAGNLVWENRTKIYEPSMIATEENLFAVSDDGIAYCWAISDGKELWKKRLGGNFSASPILCNGIIYVSDLAGKTHVFKANAEQFEPICINSLGSDCYASPAVADGQLFLRIGFGVGGDRQEKLCCIGSK